VNLTPKKRGEKGEGGKNKKPFIFYCIFIEI